MITGPPREEETQPVEISDIYLDTVVASCDPSILHLHIRWWMRELAFRVWSGALVALKFSADFQLEPSGILTVEKVVHVDHCHLQVDSVSIRVVPLSVVCHFASSASCYHSRRRRRRLCFNDIEVIIGLSSRQQIKGDTM